MAFDYKTQFHKYGRFYRGARKYTQKPEVLVSINLVLTLFAVAFFAIVAIRPTTITIAKLWKEIQDKKDTQVKLEKKIEELQKAQLAYAKIEDDLHLLKLALPGDVDFSRLALEIEYLASKHGLFMSSNRFDPVDVYVSQDSELPAGLQQHTFSLVVNGSYSQFRSFVDELENIDRLVTIHTATVNQTLDRRNLLKYPLGMSLDSSVYSFSDSGVKE